MKIIKVSLMILSVNFLFGQQCICASAAAALQSVNVRIVNDTDADLQYGIGFAVGGTKVPSKQVAEVYLQQRRNGEYQTLQISESTALGVPLLLHRYQLTTEDGPRVVLTISKDSGKFKFQKEAAPDVPPKRGR